MEQTLWLARDKNGDLWLYKEKPLKVQTMFLEGTDSESMQLLGYAYPNVTFENSPQEVKLEFI